MKNKVYSIDEIKEIVKHISKKYDVPEAYIFGSYARGEATEESDVDIMISNDKLLGLRNTKSIIKLQDDLEVALGKDDDIIAEQEVNENDAAEKMLYEQVLKDRKMIYKA